VGALKNIIVCVQFTSYMFQYISEIMANIFLISYHVALDSVANVLPWADKYLSQRVATASPRTTY
jgi:hypothetical protein